jgi:hypothetical protein
MLKNYQSVWRQIHYDVTDKNNDVSFEGHDIYYHSKVILLAKHLFPYFYTHI